MYVPTGLNLNNEMQEVVKALLKHFDLTGVGPRTAILKIQPRPGAALDRLPAAPQLRTGEVMSGLMRSRREELKEEGWRL